MVIYLNGAIRTTEILEKLFNPYIDSIKDLKILGCENFNELTTIVHINYKLTDTVIMQTICYWYELNKFTEMILTKFINNTEIIPNEFIKCINNFCIEFSNINQDKRQNWYNVFSLIPGMQYYNHDSQEYVIVNLIEIPEENKLDIQNYKGFMISFNYCSPYSVEVKLLTCNLKNIS